MPIFPPPDEQAAFKPENSGNNVPSAGPQPTPGADRPGAPGSLPAGETRTASIPPPELRGGDAPRRAPQPPAHQGTPAQRAGNMPPAPSAPVPTSHAYPPRQAASPPSRPSAPSGPSPDPGALPPQKQKNDPDALPDGESGMFRGGKRANVGCLHGLLYFLSIIGVSVFLAVFGWGCVNDVLALMKPQGEATVVVPEGFSIPELARELKEAGVIEQSWLFTLYCNFSHADKIISPGEYTLSTCRDYRALVYDMTAKAPELTTVRVKIIEGRTLMQTLRQLADAGVAPLEDLLAAAESEIFGYSFLEDLPEGENRLEGFLYPDTYDFYQGGSPRAAINKLLANFDLKYTASMRKRVSEMNYSLREVLIIASMVQMEAAGVSDMKDIASVIYNRLEKWGDNARLDIDATVQYLLPEHKEVLTAEDLAIDSPYNTRLYPGLPPGPICSPSIEAIRAALYPSNTKYFFYCMTDAGVHAFCATETELNAIKRANPKTYPR